MALQTNPNLNAQIIYELSVQNHTETHDFAGVIRDLDRIRDLGVDVVWLMPIHPRGEKMRFGVCGSPYSVKDFRAINPAYGTEADFDRLVREVHARGMKLMLDIVYNHTSQDSVLVQEHPEYFYQGADGKPMYRFWNDVYDLDYRNEDLCRYMVETALSWARRGVDGYRCDVAPMVPLSFWTRARAAMDEVNPDFIWLAETHHYPFLVNMRDRGWCVHSDAEMYQAFDITYDYDVHYFYEDYLKGKGTLEQYVDGLNRQKAMYPMNYIKLRFLENHDQARVCSLVHTDEQLAMWTAFSYFLKGPVLLYAGQEYKVAARTNVTGRTPSPARRRPGCAACCAGSARSRSCPSPQRAPSSSKSPRRTACSSAATSGATRCSWARSTSTWSPGRSPCPLPTASTRTCWAARSRSGAAARPRPCAPCCCT